MRTQPGVHVVIVGDTPMAKAVLQQVLRTGHYLPHQLRAITILVRDAAGYEAELRRQFPCLTDTAFPDFPNYQRLRDEVFPTLRFVELPDSDAELLDDKCALFDHMRADCLTSIFVCLDDGMLGSAYVAALHPKLKALRQQNDAPCQVFSYSNYPEEQPSPFSDPLGDETVPIISFGTFLEHCSVEAVEGADLDRLAMEVKAHYLQEFGDERMRSALQNMNPTDRGKFLLEEWSQVDEWERESNRQAADHIAVKLHCINAQLVSPRGEMPVFEAEDLRRRFSQEEISHEETFRQLANMEHRRWCAERLLGGWQPLEPTPRNRQRWKVENQSLKAQKRHIDLIPFSDLPTDEQKKDYSQIKAIPTILERAAAK